jgi:hypothetical protein
MPESLQVVITFEFENMRVRYKQIIFNKLMQEYHP